MALVKKYINHLFLLLFLCPSLSFAVTLNCPKIFRAGTYTGRLTDIIDKSAWSRTTFILETTDGDKGCVQLPSENDVRRKIILNAFYLNNLVILNVDSNHTIIGIGYRSDG